MASGKMSAATGNKARGSSDGEVMDSGSPRSYGASGSGPVMGAGEMPRVGPGSAAKRVKGMTGTGGRE